MCGRRCGGGRGPHDRLPGSLLHDTFALARACRLIPFRLPDTDKSCGLARQCIHHPERPGVSGVTGPRALSKHSSNAWRYFPWLGRRVHGSYCVSLLESVLILLVTCCISMGRGQDANWDLLNYHIYNAFSMFNDRLGTDHCCAGVQTYFNPLLDIPYYLLAVNILPGAPRLVAFLSGLPFGALVLVVLKITRIALRSTGSDGTWLPYIATALGVSGTICWGEIGTTFGDIPVAVIALVGLIPPLSSLVASRDQVPLLTWMVGVSSAGFLTGCATGLKLTACIYAAGGLAALTLVAGNKRRSCATAIVFSIAWTLGIILTYGWWVWFYIIVPTVRYFRYSTTALLHPGCLPPALDTSNLCRTLSCRLSFIHSFG
jgi:hypothetical protein